MTTTPPIQLSGLASGIDTGSLIKSLVAAASAPIQQMQQKQADIAAATSSLSNMSRAVSALSTAAKALDTPDEAAALSASSSSTAVGVTMTSGTTAGAYAVQVDHLAAEQRTYSASFAVASTSTAVGQSGSFSIQVGSGTAQSVSVSATDSLDNIAAKVNGLGLRVTASVFYDGSAYRLQIRGQDTGAKNALTFVESGTSLDLNGTGSTPTSGKTPQAALDSLAYIDGFAVSRPNNQISGAIAGLTLNLTAPTSSPTTVTVASSSDSLQQKVSTIISAYNAVVNSAHQMAGYSGKAASVSLLAGDSAIRTVTDKLRMAAAASYGSGTYKTLASVGITSNKDGTLALDATKLSTAVTTDGASVANLFGRALGQNSGGAMATLVDAATRLTDPIDGTLTSRSNAFTSQSKLIDNRIAAAQTRIDNYQRVLQKQFTAMEHAYSANQSLMGQIAKIG
jgi:flagellar hook-associated protein 2